MNWYFFAIDLEHEFLLIHAKSTMNGMIYEYLCAFPGMVLDKYGFFSLVLSMSNFIMLEYCTT